MTSLPAFSAVEDQSIVIDVLAIHAGSAPGPLTLFSVASTPFGAVSITEDDRLSFTPAEGVVGPVTLGYSWRDGTGRLFSEAIAGEVADAPPDPVVVAPQDATATIWKDTGRFFPLEDDIVVQDAVNGTVELGENGYVRYTPDPGFVGIDTFEYGFLDGKAPASGDVVYDADATGLVSIEVLDPVADGAVFYAFEKIQLGANPLFDYVDKLPVGAWLPSGGEVASSPLSPNISEAFSSRGYHLSGSFWSFPVAPNGGFLEPEGVALDAVFIEAGKIAPVGSGFEDDADLLMIATNLGGSGELRRYDGPFTFLGSDAADAAPLSGLSGAGTFRLLGGADTLNKTFFQSGGITVHAGDGDDRIVGTDGDDLLRGEAGDDDLRGGPGDDVVVPGDGADAVHLGQGDDLLRGTLAELADTRLEDFGIGDAIRILGGASTPFRFVQEREGTPFEHSIFEADETGNGEGDVSFTIKYANPFVALRAAVEGNDIVIDGVAEVDPDPDADPDPDPDPTPDPDPDPNPAPKPDPQPKTRLWGDEKDDVIRGDAGDQTLYGLAGEDSLMGGKGRDVLHGGRGGDLLRGGPGADELHGETGRGDEMIGGRGRDVFVVKEGALRDFVLDWRDGMDKIRIDVDGMTFRDLKIVQRGDDARVVYGSSKDALILYDVDAGDIGREDVLFT